MPPTSVRGRHHGATNKKNATKPDTDLAKDIGGKTDYIWGTDKVVHSNEDYLFG